ncbi:MAG: hypothetical protein JW741_16065, partial [Sedimentisphaerales bacterium]|nr:hypothetical protein [Sedimentisphaerales bacterium]
MSKRRGGMRDDPFWRARRGRGGGVGSPRPGGPKQYIGDGFPIDRPSPQGRQYDEWSSSEYQPHPGFMTNPHPEYDGYQGGPDAHRPSRKIRFDPLPRLEPEPPLPSYEDSVMAATVLRLVMEYAMGPPLSEDLVERPPAGPIDMDRIAPKLGDNRKLQEGLNALVLNSLALESPLSTAIDEDGRFDLPYAGLSLDESGVLPLGLPSLDALSSMGPEPMASLDAIVNQAMSESPGMGGVELALEPQDWFHEEPGIANTAEPASFVEDLESMAGQHMAEMAAAFEIQGTVDHEQSMPVPEFACGDMPPPAEEPTPSPYVLMDNYMQAH